MHKEKEMIIIIRIVVGTSFPFIENSNEIELEIQLSSGE